MIREEAEGKYGGQEIKKSDLDLCQKKIYFLKVKSLSYGANLYLFFATRRGGTTVSVELEDSSRYSFYSEAKWAVPHEETPGEPRLQEALWLWQGRQRLLDYEAWMAALSPHSPRDPLLMTGFGRYKLFKDEFKKQHLIHPKYTPKRGKWEESRKINNWWKFTEMNIHTTNGSVKNWDQMLCQEFKHLNELITFIEEDHWSETKELQEMVSR